jgi:hypothetical protein
VPGVLSSVYTQSFSTPISIQQSCDNNQITTPSIEELLAFMGYSATSAESYSFTDSASED